MKPFRILLAIPPVCEPSGPYPAIGYLNGFLKTLGLRADLADASLQTLLRIFSREGLETLRREIEKGSRTVGPEARGFLNRFSLYADTIETAVACLQGLDKGAIARANRQGYFPPALDETAAWARNVLHNTHSLERLIGPLSPSQKTQLASLSQPLAFVARGETESAQQLASTVLRDLVHILQCTVAPDFSLNGYAPGVAFGAVTFAGIRERLESAAGFVDRLIDLVADDLWTAHRPDVLGLTVPFPGNLLGALRLARRMRQHHPGLRVIVGGGWISNCLRLISDPGIFDYVDFLTLDDGERPLQCLLEFFSGERPETGLRRTFVRRNGHVAFFDGAAEADVPASATGVPDERSLSANRYLALRGGASLRPRLWSQRWHKLTLAHGCYWRKCAFCDTRLDYIGRYEPCALAVTVDRIRKLKQESGESGFHFVDEAMPPALLRQFADSLLTEKLDVTWWGNVRFDPLLAECAASLAASGCIALTGGLEIASERLLTLMNKGLSLPQIARVTHALSRAGIAVHAYLIFGFPTETEQETIDTLEFVRQLFAADCLHSVAWHRFSLTAYSPVAAEPERFSIRLTGAQTANPFVNYTLAYDEPGASDHDAFAVGLEAATDHYAAGLAWERPVRSWFERSVPSPSLSADFVRRAIGDGPTTASPDRPAQSLSLS